LLAETAVTPVNAADDHQAARPSRHGRFAGSVSVQLSSGKEIVLKSSTQFTQGIDYDIGKKASASRRRLIEYGTRTSALKVSVHCRELYVHAADELLNSAFNSTWSVGKY
jgi:hypothetical protein